jgi:CheY-like chemotaxis protein
MSADEADALPMPLILLVEDEVLIREMLVEALEHAGFSTLVSGDAQEAVLLFEGNGAEIRGLVTDINLDCGMNGWELACAVREHLADLPVVYISGASGHEWASRGVPNSLMVTKPFAPAQIVVALSSLMVATDSMS